MTQGTASNGDQDASNPAHTQRSASPAKRSAALMEGVEIDQPPPYSPTMTVDEQIQHITTVCAPLPQKDAVGYVVAVKWLQRVLARSSSADKKEYDQDTLEGEIGNIDNSSVVAPGAFTQSLRFLEETELPYIPLRPEAQIGHDYQIFPEEAWREVVEWYGIAEGQLPVVRFAHDTMPVGSLEQNVQYELNPPIFTLRKMLGSTASTDPAASEDLAVKLVASRTQRFQSFLARAKEAAKIPMVHKVRVWKQLPSAQVSADQPVTQQPDILSPPISRSTSPSSSSAPKLIVDPASFKKWVEGVDYEGVDGQDHTNNEKYNGSSTLDILALTSDQTLILEEQLRGPAGGEFASDASRKSKKNTSLNTQSEPASRRASPAPPGPVTRGRTRRDGKARGAIGLTNLGNTCYMNSALQCISRVEELAVYFLEQRHKQEINSDNPLGYNGRIANAYANLLSGIYSPNSTSAFRPGGFKGALAMAQPMFSGYGQQDSQEFLSFLVDALHEDLNRIHKKPYIENPDSDDSTVHDPEAIRQLGEKYREIHRLRNDSIAMDLFNGFYKNTMVCPACEKVSVTFDPYSLLTLQLPIENAWQGKIMFMPLTGLPLVYEVDVDKNSSVRSLKDWFISKIGRGLTKERMIFAEMFNSRFYKVFSDAQTISESGIEARDVLCMYELSGAPTNTTYVPKKSTGYRSIYNNSMEEALPGMDSPLADTMAIPVMHSRGENRNSSPSLILNPTFIVVSKEEAKDYDTILQRVLESIAPMTSKRFLEAAPEQDGEESVIKSNTKPLENGFVDVAMQEGDDASSSHVPSVSESENSIPLELRNLFELKYAKSSTDMFLTGSGSPHDVRPIRGRVQMSQQRRHSTSSTQSESSRKSRDSGYDDQSRSSVESDEDAETADLFNGEQNNFSGDVHSEDELAPMTQLENSSKQDNRRKFNNRRANKKTYSRKGRRGSKQSARSSSSRASTVDAEAEADAEAEDDEYYIRLGEGIIVDWQKDAFEALFAGHTSTEEKGRFMFDEKTMPLADDPELNAKRQKRIQRRKNGISLDDCFTETGKTEVLSEDNAWYCNRCKELRRASKTLEMWTVPDILVVHLKRFSGERYRRDKVDVVVNFPVEGLDLSQRVGCKEDGKEYIYDLFAVDNHYGGLGGGHYTAYAKNFYDGNWYDYNDSCVSRQNPEGVVSAAAYLLFYRRRSSTPLGPPYLQELVHKARNPTENGSDIDDDSGEGVRLGDSSSASSRLLGSSSAGTVGAGVGTAGIPPQEGEDGPGRGANQAARLRATSDDEEESVSLDEGFGEHNTTAITLANSEPTWSWENLQDSVSVNTPADDASDRPDAGSDTASRFQDDFVDEDQHMQEYSTSAQNGGVGTAAEDREIDVVDIVGIEEDDIPGHGEE